jgi:flavin reductase (DIM6/NTAB) family NADH-FMN oxidoreductase RutF
MINYLITLCCVVLAYSCNVDKNENDMNDFEKISWEELNDNAIRMIGHDWMLVAAGNVDEGYNMMTASWGTLGWLWQKPVSFIFVRPQRYTFQFTEKEDYYTISFFEEEHKDILKLMGTVSGRDFDKIKDSGLTAFSTDNSSVGFNEASIVIECKKLYATVIDENDFVDKKLVGDVYPQKDFHTMYVGEIVNVYRRKK